MTNGNSTFQPTKIRGVLLRYPSTNALAIQTTSGTFASMQAANGLAATMEWMGARSKHPGGVHILMVDGSAHFVSNDIDHTEERQSCGDKVRPVWQAIHTRRGNETVGEY